MEDKRTDLLLTKYLSGEASPAEIAELADLLSLLPDHEADQLLRAQWEQMPVQRTLDADRSEQILQAIKGPKKVRRLLVISSAVAAAVIGCIALIQLSNRPSHPLPTPASVVRDFDRHIQLPDHSVVVLHKGSTLQAISNRQVRLSGEAYFEITHNKDTPFVIYAGNVKTTVLGTSFDIRAWPGEKKVTVSVTSGKVRVEEGQRVLALLTANQQVSYNAENNDTKQDNVDAAQLVAKWAPKDLVFKGQDLQTIMDILSRRYDKKIIITDPELTTTQVVSSFDAAEPLDSILSIICTMNKNTTYRHEGDQIIISRN